MDINAILSEIVKISAENGVTKAVLFGSLAKGTQRDRSDIDIAFYGADSLAFSRIQDSIADISTLRKIDAINMETLNNPNLAKEVEMYGQTIYAKN